MARGASVFMLKNEIKAFHILSPESIQASQQLERSKDQNNEDLNLEGNQTDVGTMTFRSIRYPQPSQKPRRTLKEAVSLLPHWDSKFHPNETSMGWRGKRQYKSGFMNRESNRI